MTNSPFFATIKIDGKNSHLKNKNKNKMANASAKIESFHLQPISWKSYHHIKKKAMEQEFSWSGLLISLSIAFFVVVACAQGLKIVYQSVESAAKIERSNTNFLYKLENRTFINNKELVDVQTIKYLV